MATQITNYQCPACTGPLRYDGSSGKLVCDYCGSTYTTEEIEALYAEANEKAEQAQPQEQVQPEETEWDTDSDGVLAYSCPSCGAELLCEETTAATSCPYCGNPTVVPEKVSGVLKPDYIIPFKLDKKAAVDALSKHYKGKLLLPKAFTADNHIEEIQGIYVPFWLFDGQAAGRMTFKATRTRTYRTAHEIINETNHFSVIRGGTMEFHRVPADGSSKMPDDLMDSVEPYNYGEMVPFSMSYLPGFLADKYDVSAEAVKGRAERRMTGSLQGALTASAAGYETCVPLTKDLHITRLSKSYALMPVWLLHTKWQDKDYHFAMNGQTGRMVGNLPVSGWKLAAWFSGIFTAVGTVVFLAQLLF